MIRFVIVAVLFAAAFVAVGFWIGYRWAVEEAKYRESVADLRPGGGPL